MYETGKAEDAKGLVCLMHPGINDGITDFKTRSSRVVNMKVNTQRQIFSCSGKCTSI